MLESTSNIFRVDLGEKSYSNTLRTNLLDVITYSAAISACEKAHEFLERFFFNCWMVVVQLVGGENG